MNALNSGRISPVRASDGDGTGDSVGAGDGASVGVGVGAGVCAAVGAAVDAGVSVRALPQAHSAMARANTRMAAVSFFFISYNSFPSAALIGCTQNRTCNFCEGRKS